MTTTTDAKNPAWRRWIRTGGLTCMAALALPATAATVSSPEGVIKIEVLDNDGRLTWSVERDGQAVLLPAPLGITVDGANLGEGASLGEAKLNSIDETYPIYGVHSTAVNRATEAIFPVTHESGTTYELHVRAYDDGAAVRYVVPAGEGMHRISGEATAFGIPGDVTIWWGRYDHNYEEVIHTSTLETMQDGQTMCPPTLIRVGEDVFVAMTEANNAEFPDMGLQREGNLFRAILPSSPRGWRHEGDIETPWRAAIIAKGLNALVNSDLITNLCPPPDPKYNFDEWVRPGRSLWHWWAIGAPRLEDQKNWIDAARRLGFEYYLIDEGWRNWRAEGKDQWQLLGEVIEYAKSQGVDALVWVNSGEMRDPAERRAYLERVAALGAVGIKIDFIPDCTADVTRWYEDTLRETAELRLMTNFHGSVKFTGRQRTWRHELTREAVRGHEWHMTRYGRVQADDHDQIVLFTRYLCGPADYTPTAFDPRELVGYTWGHLLAQAVNMTSPIIHFAGAYRDFIGNPAENFLRHLPAVWDETIVLPGSEIAKTVGFARRSGDEWFIGVLHGTDQSEFEINFSFLGDGLYEMLVFGDDLENPAAFDIQTRTVTKNDNIKLQLAHRGGASIWFRPVQ